jgi:hypothetical protein
VARGQGMSGESSICKKRERMSTTIIFQGLRKFIYCTVYKN